MSVSSTDVQRLFLQAVFSRGLVSAKLAQILWEKSTDAVKAADDSLDILYSKEKEAWEAFVAKINRSLNDLDLEFRHLHDETSGREMYALVNRKGDEIAQMATDYTPAEIAYFKLIVEQIMIAPHESFCVSSLVALRELSSIKPKSNMSKSQAETVLGSFVAKGWLLKSKSGRYSLSTRSLLELLPYLKATHPDEIIECTICMEILTRGIACHTPNCKTRMHFHCFTSYRRRHGSCPSCTTDWPREMADKPLVPVGERAVREGQDGVRRRVRVKSVDASDDGDDEPMDGEDASQTPSQTRTQRSQGTKKGKGRASQVDISMDVDTDGEEEGKEEDPTPRKSQPTRRSSRR